MSNFGVEVRGETLVDIVSKVNIFTSVYFLLNS